MNVYDFDKTIYNGDCSIDFYKFCVKKQVSLLIYLPLQILAFIFYLAGVYNKTQFKEKYFIFLKRVNNVDARIKEFVLTHKCKFALWYIENKRDDDVIISASPEFILKPLLNEVGVCFVIGSQVDKLTGKFKSPNCYGLEKLKRLQERFPNVEIQNFYTDSLSDVPLAENAQNAYIVVSDEKITPYKDYKPPLKKKLKTIFLSAEFIRFLIIGTINAINGVVFAYLFSLIIENVNLAFIAGYIVSLSVSYILNSFYVFKKDLSFIKYFKFCASYIPNFAVQVVCVFIFNNILHLYKIYAYIIAVIIGVPVTFLLLKLFTFGKSKRQK